MSDSKQEVASKAEESAVSTVPPIELKVPLDAEGQVDPIASVSWCIDQGFVRRVETDPDITDPHLLLLVCIGEKVVERHLVPLNQQPLRMVFHGSGKNTLRATTVWPKEGENRSNMRKSFFDKDYEDYVEDPVEWGLVKADWDERTWVVDAKESKQVKIVGEPEVGPDGQWLWRIEGSDEKVPESQLRAGEMKNAYTMRKWLRGCQRHEEEDVVVVKIEEGLFASEPPKLLRKLVELYPWWKNSDPRDQCHFRRRATIAVPLSLVLAGPAAVVCVILLGCLALYEVLLLLIIGLLHVAGRRGINYRALRHPIDTPPKRIWSNLGNSRWFRTKDGELTLKALRAVNPLTYLVAGVIVWGLALLSLYHLGGILLVAVPLGACFVLGLVAPIFLRPLGAFFIAWGKRRSIEAKAKKRRELEEYKAQLQSFVCGSDGRPVASRTVRMRLSEMGYKLKDQVCRPYAQYRG